jgi:hypothetical protein
MILPGTYVSDGKVETALEQFFHWHIDSNDIWRRMCSLDIRYKGLEVLCGEAKLTLAEKRPQRLPNIDPRDKIDPDHALSF